MPFSLFSKLNTRIDNFNSLQRVLSLLVIILFIVLVNWLIDTTPDFYNATLPRNQAYTELAFDNVNDLPSKISSGNQVKFAFMIHNVEGKTISYPYAITLESGNVNKTLKTGTTILASNNAVSISENLSIQSSNQRQEVVITLINLKQSIGLWLEAGN